METSGGRSQRIASDQALSPTNAQAVALSAWYKGRVHTTAHFRRRSLERDFGNVDVENAILRGIIRLPPEFSVRFRNWVYMVERRVPGEAETLGIVFAVDLRAYCDEDPLIVLITGRWLSVN